MGHKSDSTHIIRDDSQRTGLAKGNNVADIPECQGETSLLAIMGH